MTLPRGSRRPITRGGALLASLVLLGLLGFIALIGPWLPVPDPLAIATDQRLRPPDLFTGGNAHVLGTDGLGRDLASRLVLGARLTVIIGVVAVAMAATFGVGLGLVAGYCGGPVERLVMRTTDVQLSIPTLALVLALVAATGPGLLNVIVALTIVGWVPYARLVRAEILSLREREYVLAAHLLGANGLRIMVRHLLPGVSISIVVLATSQIPQMILTEASLSYLGLGVQPPAPTWGNMVADGRAYFTIAPWISLLPGLALTLTTLAINTLGDWLAGWLARNP